MRYSLAKLTADVMSRLGEVAGPEISASGDDTQEESSLFGSVPSPEDIIGIKIRSMLPEVGSRLIMEAEAPWPPEGGVLIETSPSGGRGAAMPCGLFGIEVPIPAGFLRLVSVRMGEWRHDVSTAVGPGNDDWNRQWSEEPGIAGCPESPSAYVDVGAEGAILRLMGSRNEEDTLEWLRIWKVPEVDDEGCFDFPSALYPSLVAILSAD